MFILSNYIDTMSLPDEQRVIEGLLQDRFLALLQSQSDGSAWSLAKKFYKVVFNRDFVHPTTGPAMADQVEFPVYVAKHYLIANSNLPKAYLGMAIIGSITPKYVEVEQDKRPANPVDATSNVEFINWVKSKVAELETDPLADEPKMTCFFSSAVVYFYMTDRLPSIEDGGWGLLPWDATSVGGLTNTSLERACLDVEVWKGLFKVEVASSVPKFVIEEPELYVMQSPITKCILRYPKAPIEDLWSEEFKVSQNDTNWWYDSDVHVSGCLDEEGFFLIIQADTAPAWEDNITPSIPLYFGSIDTVDNADKCVAFFAGTMPDATLSEISRFDFNDASTDNFRSIILPILKTYPRHPSNGLDTVMVKKSKYGARYQSYYLAWNTASNGMPPDRQNNHSTEFSKSADRGYPRAWNQQGADEYAYWFNPSRYSRKIHTSKIYLIHPEEGVRGNLRWSVGLSPIGVSCGNKIRVLVDTCDETTNKPVYEYYRYSTIDGVSPLTKQPGTPYRPIGLGIRDDTIA